MRLDGAGAAVNAETLMPMVAEDETAADIVPLLLISEPQREPGEVIDHVLQEAEKCVVTLRLMAISTRIAGISQDALAAERSGEQELHSRLTYEQLELEKIKHGLLNRMSES
jgi:hypothetical protein